MKFIKVQNIKEKDFTLGREVWEGSKKEGFTLCSCRECIKKAEVGSGVEIVDVKGTSTSYIVPLCTNCNSKMDDYYVDINDLVSIEM